MTGVGFTLFWATHFPIHNWGISFSVCNFICLSLCFTAAVLKCYLLLNCARAHMHFCKLEVEQKSEVSAAYQPTTHLFHLFYWFVFFFFLFCFHLMLFSFFIEHKVRKHAAAVRYRRQPWEANDVGQTSRLHGGARDAHSSMSNHFKKPTRSLSFVCVVSGAWRFYRGEGSHTHRIMSDEICLLCLFLWQIWPFWFQLTFSWTCDFFLNMPVNHI